jgi:hypothetical protein
LFQLLGLAAPDVESRVRRGEALHEGADDLGTRRVRQPCQLLEMLVNEALGLVEMRGTD